MEIKYTDVVELFNILENQHPNLYFNISKEKFWEQVNALEHFWAKFDVYKQNFYLKHLFALIGDLHTMCFFTFSEGKDFPFEVKRLAGKYYISNLDADFIDKKYLFAEILGLNNLAISEVEKLICQILPAEIKEGKFGRICTHLTYLNVLKTIGVVSEDQLTLMVKQNDEQENIKIQAVRCDKNKYIFKPSLPYLFENQDLHYYFKIKDFALSQTDLPHGYDARFNNFVLSALNKFGKKPVVVDLRDNAGGYASMFNIVFDEFEKQGLPLYCLLNNNSLSASVMLATRIKNCGGLLVGENAGQPYKFFAYGGGVQATKSGIRFKCSKKLVSCKVNGKRQNKNKPFMVDVEIMETIEDIKKGIDKPLEFCVKNIKKLNAELAFNK